MKKTLLFWAFLAFSAGLFGQDVNLANQYFSNGEFEKAASIYLQLWEKDERSEYYFSRYVESLLALDDYENCEKALKKQSKKSGDNPKLYVTWGTVFKQQGKTDEAKTQWAKAVSKMPADYSAVNLLAQAFMGIAEYEQAIAAYERGAELLKDRNRFAYNLGELYRRKGDNEKMIEQYLLAIDQDPSKAQQVKGLFQRFLTENDLETLQSQLFGRIQANDSPDMIDLLAWTFIQKKDYKNALRQVKALDRKLADNGNRVMNLAETAAADRDYDAAIDGYGYIIAEKGKTSTYYLDAKRESMNSRRKKLTDGFSYTPEDLRVLEAEHVAFLDEFGRNRQTAGIVLQLAELEAFYLNDLKKAVNLLDSLTKMPSIDRNSQARAKLALADYYLMDGEIWESTLLYSQVDKDFKEEVLGQEARFRNARLSYWNGDFEWSQSQFDILKSATSRLISNDALDLSVFIMDGLGLDSTTEALALYAQAELFIFQNRFGDAFLKLDTLRKNYPEHGLQDDLLYLEAQVHLKKREWRKAADLFQKIADEWKEEIRADNSLYALAQLFENQLSDKEKAMSIYEKIYTDYSGSVFAVDARKRFRVLRGDKVQ